MRRAMRRTPGGAIPPGWGLPSERGLAQLQVECTTKVAFRLCRVRGCVVDLVLSPAVRFGFRRRGTLGPLVTLLPVLLLKLLAALAFFLPTLARSFRGLRG